MRASLSRDDSAVSSTMEFMLSFIIAAGIFSLFIMNFQSLFMSQPQYVVMTNQLVDVGNDVSTKIIDTYLVIPDNGTVATYFEIPGQTAGQPYEITILPSGDDRDLVISTMDERVTVHMTLNGANSTIPINGSTTSTSLMHGIVYHSNL